MLKKLSFIWLLVLVSFGANANYAPLVSNKANISVVANYADSPTIQNGFSSELVSFQDIDYRFPSIDRSGRLYYGTIAQNIIDVLNTDPAGKLTHKQELYVLHTVGGLRHVWDKIIALYGFVGGTAYKHKYNWKDMRDLNTAYRISWFNNVTHSVFGVTSTENDSYGDKYLVTASVFSQSVGRTSGLYSYSETVTDNVSSVSGINTTPRQSFIANRLNTKFMTFGNREIRSNTPYSKGTAIYTISGSTGHIVENGSIGGVYSSISNSFPEVADGSERILTRRQPTVVDSYRATVSFYFDALPLTQTESVILSNNITFAQSFR